MADAPTQAWSGARLRGGPRGLVATLIAVELVAVLVTAVALARSVPGDATLTRLAVLIGLSIVFEEIALQVGKLRLLISTGPQPDMTSVWTFAGTLVLPAPYAALLAVAIATGIWFRRQRAAGQYLYRKLYSAATVMLACFGAAEIRTAMHGEFRLPAGLDTTVAIIIAGVGYTVINRLLIVIAAHLANPDAPLPILGSWADNGLELSTLCLGAMTAIVLTHQAGLTVVVLMPMILLQRGALIKQLETAAAIDAKTGLLNAVAWQETAKRELDRAKRERTAAALLLIDLDHFKVVNDTYGHLVGDAALRLVGARLKSELRQYDVVGRFGGEEFVALLPGITAGDAFATAERIRGAIASIGLDEVHRATHVGQTVEPAEPSKLAASVGLAHYPAHAEDLESLLRSADSALYYAKRAGRNQVAVFRATGPERTTAAPDRFSSLNADGAPH